MKQLKLIPQSWHPADVVPATSPPAGRRSHIAGTPPGAVRLPREELESPAWKTIPADKSETLRDYLSTIDHVPVRRVKSSECSGSCMCIVATLGPVLFGHHDRWLLFAGHFVLD